MGSILNDLDTVCRILVEGAKVLATPAVHEFERRREHFLDEANSFLWQRPEDHGRVTFERKLSSKWLVAVEAANDCSVWLDSLENCV